MKASLVILIAAMATATLAGAVRPEVRAVRPPLSSIPLPERDPGARWRDAGFVRLEPPIALPVDEAQRLSAEIWVRVPDGAQIDVVDGRWVWPIGAELDRIEWVTGDDGRRRIADVRGTEITADGDHFHMYRPASPEATALVAGSFFRGDERAREAVRLAFAALGSEGGGFARGDRGAIAAHREASIARLGRLLDCAGCHERSVPEATDEGRWLRRATDDAGFYVPAYVMRDEAPMERYRPIDVAEQSRFVGVRCEGQPASSTGRTDLRCPNGSVPILELDVASALEASDPHARDVCRSRRWLGAHMTPRARTHYRDALAACGDAP